MGTIVKEEGVSGLFVGAGTTAIRAMALNMGMLASNEQAKELIIAAGESFDSIALWGNALGRQ